MAITEAQARYFDEITPRKTVGEVSTEALQMKGFIDGLTEAMKIEPDFTEDEYE